jgi:hypothetical protein
MIMAVLGATIVGLAALVGFADHNTVFAADDEDQAAQIKTFGSAKINLQQGLIDDDDKATDFEMADPTSAAAAIGCSGFLHRYGATICYQSS